MRARLFVDSLFILILLFTSSAKAAANSPVLMILSNATEIPLADPADPTKKSGDVLPAGVFRREAMGFLSALRKAQIPVVFATVTGKAAKFDPFSLKQIWYLLPNLPLVLKADEDKLADAVMAENAGTVGSFQTPYALDGVAVNQALLETFKAFVIPGGHGVVLDLINNPSLGKILRYATVAGKVVATICHGSSTILAARDANSSPYEKLPTTMPTMLEEDTYLAVRPDVVKEGQKLYVEVKNNPQDPKSESKVYNYVDVATSEVGKMFLRSNPIPAGPRILQVERKNDDGTYANLVAAENPNSAYPAGDLLVETMKVNDVGAFRKLRTKTHDELFKIFLSAGGKVTPATKLPNGQGSGMAFFVGDQEAANKKLKKLLSGHLATRNLDVSLNELSKLFWGGKDFTVAQGSNVGTLKNRLLPFLDIFQVFDAITAKVKVRNPMDPDLLNVNKDVPIPSFAGNHDVTLDGFDSIVLDYSVSWLPWFNEIVDMIRPVDGFPGAFLGMAFTKASPVSKREFFCFFGLQFDPNAI